MRLTRRRFLTATGVTAAGALAVVRGVGYPKPARSHFRSMAIWQTAAPDTQSRTGWIGRWLDATGDDPLRAVSVEPSLPPLLAGDTTAGASLPANGLNLPKGALGDAFRLLGSPQAGEGAELARAAKSVTDLHNAAKVLGTAIKGMKEDGDVFGSHERNQ